MANEKDLKDMLTDMDLDNVAGGSLGGDLKYNLTITGHVGPLSGYRFIIMNGTDGNTYIAPIHGGHALTTALPLDRGQAEQLKETCKGQVLMGSLDCRTNKCDIFGKC